MKTYPKQFRLTTDDIRRIEYIQEHYKKSLNDENITFTDALRMAIIEAYFTIEKRDELLK